MAKRRRVSNLLGLAVLATVIQRPMYPYEMATLMRERGKERDMQIKWGSLYTVVQNLERHGFLEASGSARQGSRPERTLYRLTDTGRAELEDWLRELVSTPEREPGRFVAALSVIGVLPPGEVIELLRQRLDQLETDLAQRREALVHFSSEVPRLFLIESEFDLAMGAAEAAWVTALLDEMTSGSLPGLAAWQTWHETGEVPQELRDSDP